MFRTLSDFLYQDAPDLSAVLNSKQIGGVAPSLAYLALAQSLLRQPRSILVVCESHSQIERLAIDFEEVLAETMEVRVLCQDGLEPYEHASPHVRFWEERLEIFKAHQENQICLWLCSPETLLQRIPDPSKILAQELHLQTKQIFDPESLCKKLVYMGYHEESTVEKPGEFSRRGGIIDLYPLLQDKPFRIDFFDNEIDSIRCFDVFTQRSKEILASISIPLFGEIPIDFRPQRYDPNSQWNWWRRSKWSTIQTDWLSFFSSMDKIILGDMNFDAILPQWDLKFQEAYAQCPKDLELDPPKQIWLSADYVQKKLKSISRVYFQSLSYGIGSNIHSQSQSKGSADFSHLNNNLQTWQSSGVDCFFISPSQTQAQRLLEHLQNFSSDHILIASWAQGFISDELGFALLSDQPYFQYHRTRRTKKTRFGGSGIAIADFDSLDVGDYVIHADYGVGRFIGIKRERTVHGDFDCIVLEYSDRDRLTIPISDLSKLERLLISEETEPNLHSINSKRWEQQKEKARKKAALIARELVEIYAKRSLHQGFAFSENEREQELFDMAFPWESTPDQSQAHADVKRDMHSHRPMDRLICGDVGFGKTEIAMRAAFRCVSAGKQAAVLVPTTLLAAQHWENFADRFNAWPVRIELLSRFRSPKERKKIISDLKNGTIDLVVGTSSLISKDIQFKDLGLLIIDEEQKFGVKQKEKIREFRTLVDTLTLSATPIPRTLHLSLVGARDISIIRTPPRQRLPIETRLITWNGEVIGDTLKSEIARGGQCFVVQDRIEGLIPLAEKISSLVPNASIAILHGQMDEFELEKTMAAFSRGDYDILVSTNIIESGIDIPRANTIIIFQAHRFGLSQLYQLRGRVGRSDLSARCLLVLPQGIRLSKESEGRLQALEAHTDLGSGFKLAMRDLEIRGTGNLLGMEQSGNFLEVGYETYTRLIREELMKLRGENIAPILNPKVNLELNAYLPETYIQDGIQRLSIYQKIARAETDFEIIDIQTEVKDRYGEIPAATFQLLSLMRLRLALMKWGIGECDFQKSSIAMTFANSYQPNRKILEQLVVHAPWEIQISMAEPIAIKLISGRELPESILEKTLNWLLQTKKI